MKFENQFIVSAIKFRKVKVDNDQEMAQTERNSLSKNRGGKNKIDN